MTLCLSVKQAAAELCVSPYTVRRLIHQGLLPTVPGLGDRQVITWKALEQYAHSNIASTSPGGGPAAAPSGEVDTVVGSNESSTGRCSWPDHQSEQPVSGKRRAARSTTEGSAA